MSDRLGFGEKKRVLFLCVHNSCRSQMAEAFVNHEMSEEYLALSAGSEPTGLDPRAVQVMAEIDIDISQNRPKSAEEFRVEKFDLVITLCAEDYCPVWVYGGQKIHAPFSDPHSFEGDEAKILDQYRWLREEIRKGVRQLLLALPERREK